MKLDEKIEVQYPQIEWKNDQHTMKSLSNFIEQIKGIIDMSMESTAIANQPLSNLNEASCDTHEDSNSNIKQDPRYQSLLHFLKN